MDVANLPTWSGWALIVLGTLLAIAAIVFFAMHSPIFAALLLIGGLTAGLFGGAINVRQWACSPDDPSASSGIIGDNPVKQLLGKNCPRQSHQGKPELVNPIPRESHEQQQPIEPVEPVQPPSKEVQPQPEQPKQQKPTTPPNTVPEKPKQQQQQPVTPPVQPEQPKQEPGKTGVCVYISPEDPGCGSDGKPADAKPAEPTQPPPTEDGYTPTCDPADNDRLGGTCQGNARVGQ